MNLCVVSDLPRPQSSHASPASRTLRQRVGSIDVGLTCDIVCATRRWAVFRESRNSPLSLTPEALFELFGKALSEDIHEGDLAGLTESIKELNQLVKDRLSEWMTFNFARQDN